MIEGWKEVKIKDYPITIIDGDRGKNYPKKSEFLSKGYCVFLNTGNVSSDGFNFSNIEFITKEKDELLRKGKLKRYDTVLTTRGTIGNVGYFSSNVMFDNIRINSGMVVLRPQNLILNPQFFYQLVKSAIFQDQASVFSYGAAQPQLPIGTLNHIKLPLPPLPTQRKIAKILSAYDDLIENNLKRIKLLEEMAQKTYEEWFVFRKIDNQLINDSQIELQNLEDLIANYMNGGWGKETEEGNYTVPAYVIRGTDMPDISSGSFDKLPLRFHTGSNFKSRELKYGDVIIEMSNGNMDNVGRSFYYDRDFGKLIEHPAMCASFCKMLRPKSIELSYVVNSHIKYIYTTNRMLVYKSQAANGINNFRFEDMIADEILSIPKGDLMNKLVATLKPKYELISNIRNQIRLLKEARDILLPRLMTGMIDVSEIETELSMAAEDGVEYGKEKI